MGMAAADSEFHVLAVDDSIIDRKLIERLLKTSCFQVTTVDSGSKALKFLGWNEEDDDDDDERKKKCNETSVSPKSHHQEVEVNLVITDYCMPGMTGYDLLRKMKESSYLRNIPVVIMSSENVPSRISRCLEEGAEEFFLKPVRLSDVNKLRPHMMKTKDMQIQKPQNQEEKQENDQETTQEQGQEPSTSQIQFQTAQSMQQQQPQNNITNSNNNSNNNKRKSIDEGLSLNRTRPRYNGGLTVMSN